MYYGRFATLVMALSLKHWKDPHLLAEVSADNEPLANIQGVCEQVDLIWSSGNDLLQTVQASRLQCDANCLLILPILCTPAKR